MELPRNVNPDQFRGAATQALAKVAMSRLAEVLTTDDMAALLDVSDRTTSRHFGSHRGLEGYVSLVSKQWSDDAARRERINLLSKIFAEELERKPPIEVARFMVEQMFKLQIDQVRHELPVTLMVQCAAQGLLAEHARTNEGPPSTKVPQVARKIMQIRQDLFRDAALWLSDALTILLRHLKRRPAQGLTMEQASTAAHAAYDGFIIRHLADPEGLPIDAAVDAMFRMFLALTEPGAWPSKWAHEPVAHELLTLGCDGAFSPFSLESAAEKANLELTEAQRIFEDTQGFAIECMRTLIGIGDGVTLWGEVKVANAEAISGASSLLTSLDTLAGGQPAGLLAAAGDRAQEVWSEAQAALSGLLGQVTGLEQIAPGAANAFVSAAKKGDLSWRSIFDDIVRQ